MDITWFGEELLHYRRNVMQYDAQSERFDTMQCIVPTLLTLYIPDLCNQP